MKEFDKNELIRCAKELKGNYPASLISAFDEIASREPLTDENCDLEDIPWDDDDFSRRICNLATRPPDDTLREVDFLIKKCRLKPGMKILDIASGNGRLSNEFALRGFKVLGIDKGVGGIEYAKSEAEKRGIKGVEFVCANAAEYKFTGKYDFAMIIFGAIANLTPDESKRLIVNLSRALRDNAELVIEVCTSLDDVRGDSQEWYFSSSGLWGDSVYLVLTENYFNVCEEYMAIRHWIVDIASGNLRLVSGREQYYNLESLKSLLKKGGFHVKKAYSDWSGNPYTDEGSCMIVRAGK